MGLSNESLRRIAQEYVPSAEREEMPSYQELKDESDLGVPDTYEQLYDKMLAKYKKQIISAISPIIEDFSKQTNQSFEEAGSLLFKELGL